MTFGALEASTQDGQPVEIYRFSTAAGLEWRFTNAEVEISDPDTLVYTPASIKRDQYQQSQSKDATQMVVTLPYLSDITDEFATQFVDKPPEGLTTLTIQRMHLTDVGNEFVQFWQGSIRSASYNEEGEVEILCNGVKNIFAREGPRRNWGAMCGHTLYDNECLLLAADFTDFNVLVAGIAADGITITVSGLSSPLRDFLSGKMVKDNGKDNRLIVGQAGNVLTLQQPFRTDFIVGTTVDIEQGCDHSITGDCLTAFNNVINFGGIPYTPGLNPAIEGLDKL